VNMRRWARRASPGGALAMMRRISALREISGDFDAMLIDQFGVLHDGQALYPGAAQVMSELHSAHIPVVVMTNSAKRSAPNTERVVRMGIPRAQFVDCVSSGEVAFQSLDVTTAYLIGKDGEDYGFDPIRFVAKPEDADVMLIMGSDAPRTTLQQYRERFAGLKLPAVCCNPDKLMMTPDGLQAAPGAIAAVYEELGGKVTWIGKPYPEIYWHALKLLGEPGRVLCIGDSAEHDVAGGKRAGLATLLVQQGVSADVAETDIHPQADYVVARFSW
jgi:HAD superfamily hydrolase (TIGR01459 family)